MEPTKHGSKQLGKSTRPPSRKPVLNDNSIKKAISVFTRLSSYQALLPKKYPNTVIASIGELLHGFAGIKIEPSADHPKNWDITFLHNTTFFITYSVDDEPTYQWRKVNQFQLADSVMANTKYCCVFQNHDDEHATSVLGCITRNKVLDPPMRVTTSSFYIYFSTGFTLHYSGVVKGEDGEEYYNFVINNQHKSPGFFRTVGPLRIVGHGGTINHTRYLTSERNVYRSNMPPYSTNVLKEMLDAVEKKGNQLFKLDIRSSAAASTSKSTSSPAGRREASQPYRPQPKDKSTMKVDKSRYSAEPTKTTAKVVEQSKTPSKDVIVRKSKQPKKNMTIDEYKQLLAEGKIKVKKH